MKKTFLISLLCLLWVVILAKTIQAIQYHDLSPTAHYYGGMLANTWQAHFNVDLFIHTILFACWIFYREKSKVVGVLCGAAAIYFGAIFSIGYIVVLLLRSKSDAGRVLKGKQVVEV